MPFDRPLGFGRIERWHKSLKSECIRPGPPLAREDGLRLIQTYVDHYNTVRLPSAIGYVRPHDMLTGRAAEIHAARNRELEEARHQRQLRRAFPDFKNLIPLPERIGFQARLQGALDEIAISRR